MIDEYFGDGEPDVACLKDNDDNKFELNLKQFQKNTDLEKRLVITEKSLNTMNNVTIVMLLLQTITMFALLRIGLRLK